MVDDQINTPHGQFIPLVDIRVMQDCVNGLKNNKAPGLDGISSEHQVWRHTAPCSLVLTS